MVNIENKITAGVFVAIALLMGGLYATADLNKTYTCDASGLVGYCDKLTTNNTRCYYVSPETNKTTFKGCSSGWTKVSIPKQVNDNLCITRGDYTYCCEGKQIEKGSCDFIVRRLLT